MKTKLRKPKQGIAEKLVNFAAKHGTEARVLTEGSGTFIAFRVTSWADAARITRYDHGMTRELTPKPHNCCEKIK